MFFIKYVKNIIMSLLGMVMFVNPSIACSPGFYSDSLGICLPYGPSVPANIIPGQLDCAQWAVNPMYIQTTTAMRSLNGQLASAGVTDEQSCESNKDIVAGVIADQTNLAVGAVADDLFRCACKNTSFSSVRIAPVSQLMVCKVNPSELPVGTPSTLCDGSGYTGQSCTCPYGPNGGYSGTLQSAPSWWKP